MDIRNIFRKKEKNKLLISTPGLDGNQDLINALQPCSRNLPPYWKDLTKGNSWIETIRFKNDLDKLNDSNFNLDEKRKINEKLKKNNGGILKNGRSMINASTCPSFVEIFKNSFLIKTPCEIFVDIDNNNINVESAEKYLLDISFHDLNNQLWGDFNPNLRNIKFSLPYRIKTSEKRAKLVFLDNVYYSDLPFKVMPGVVSIDNKFVSHFNLNTTIDRRYFKNNNYQKIIKVGTPLAMIYMPDGLLDLEFTQFPEEPKIHFIGDYLKKLQNK